MKRIFRILLWIAGVVVALLIVAVVLLKIFFPTEKVKAMAIEEGTRVLQREVSVTGLDLSFWGGLGVQLTNVKIGNPEGFEGREFLTADAIDLKLRLLPLITGDVRVDRLIIVKPTITMHKLADGTNNYTFEFPDSTVTPEVEEMTRDMAPEAKPAAAAISFDELEIRSGTLVYIDDSTSTRAEVFGLNLATALENPDPGFFNSSGNLAIDSVKAATETPYPTASLSLNYRIGYDMTTQAAAIERADLGINDIRLKISGDIREPLGNTVARLNVQSDRVTVSDLLSLLPKEQLAAMQDYTINGEFELDADVEYQTLEDSSALAYSGTATLIGIEMSSTKIDGKLVLGRCLADFKNDNVRMTIEDGSFDGKPLLGHLVVENFDNPSISGQLAGGFDLAFVQPFLPPDAGHQVTGQAQFDLKFSGLLDNPEALDFSGTVGVKEGTYNSSLVPEPISNLALDAYFDNRLLNVRQLDARFTSGNVGFTGRINDLVPYLLADSVAAARIKPAVEGNLKGNVDLAIVNAYLPEKGDPSLNGKLAVDLTMTGRVGDLASFRPRGTMSVTEASYTDSLLPEPIEQLAASFRLTPDTIVVSMMSVKFTTSDVSFQGRLADPFPYLLPVEGLDRASMKKPFFEFSLSSTRFDTDKLFPEAVPGSAADPTQISADSVSFILLPDVDGRGTFNADTIIYSSVEFTNVQGKIKIYDRRIEAYDATANVYTGTVKGETTINLSDFENPVYTGEFEASGIEANDFVARFSKFGGHLFGKGEFSGSYNAVGWDPDEFINSLDMNMDATVRDGKIVLGDAAVGLLKQIPSIGSIDKENAFRSLTSNVQVKDGRVKLDQLKTRLGDLGDLTLNGWYAFDGALDYTGSVLLTEETSERLKSTGGLLGGLASALGGDNKRISLPITIKGTMDKPVPSIDTESLTKKAGDNLIKDAGSALENLFKKKKD